MGDDLHERDTGAVVVDERVVGTLDPAGGPSHVGVLAGVFLHVGALDGDGDDGAVLEFDLDLAFGRDGLIGLAGLEVLGHVRVEVVLAGEPAGLGDLAAERQTDLDRVLHTLLVDHGQGPGQAEGGGGHVGVRSPAEGVGGGVEHLGRGAEFDVDLDADDRIVFLDRVFVFHLAFSPSARVSSTRPPADSSAASKGPATS